jgi:large conductance mechanosensitive channel
MWREFKAFLLKQNALALAIAVVLGAAMNQVVTSIVDNFIMPLVALVTPASAWEDWAFTIGTSTFGVGKFLSAVLNFLIVGFVVWRLSKFVPAPPAGPAMKECPKCFTMIDPRATRCPSCTSELAG